ncbi:Aminopeptidase N [Pedobacter sp. Bi27]|uniref:M1 family aminopeptidase n=1 Tax=unclassified Pedobacter TaxID=2628915 RepID=UPI001DD731DD|nr:MULTISPECIES: M1 family aminopeptidase [unclassified Pedobacter]CAH0154088.1 Aminopeptidase N [Pedobacter sp. Bi36]CAH0210354.1 Aminopeptidase N [Pedobacter sp. Bi126]CAH0268013.1 Aminopeptidase N [Pedobacter sp. Bi27]
MNTIAKYFCFFFLLSATGFAQQVTNPVAVEPGVSLALASSRSAAISNIQYKLHFIIPAEQTAPIQSTENIDFKLNRLIYLQVDFKQSADHIKRVSVNGKTIPIDFKAEHILVKQEYLKVGDNHIEIGFIAGNESLNRNKDFLYALFVPDHARTVFPCFDQPDLKSKFLLSLTVPTDWQVMANAIKKYSFAQGNSTTYHFNNSDKLPTYLFSFTAGKYTLINREMKNNKMEFLHRETDSAKIKLSVDSVFVAHRDALDFLEDWTAIKYPFQKVGFVSIPDFQFGGMEHPGEVQYKASALFLDQGATKDQFISRSNLISHETAHMWFGDLVTMKWFNDVWMKEVFANFMADKVTEKLMGKSTFDLKFLQDHYPAAYGVDRTLGANPIRQQLDNLQEAGSMYGNIIYHKAPIMMRQLELLMGKQNFQQGIREYLKKYSYSNATWNDLIAILSKYSKSDLQSWNKVWVNEPGRPVFSYDIKYNGDKISDLSLNQSSEMGQPRVWPQSFTVKLVYPTASKILVVDAKLAKTDLIEAKGLPKPLYILFNANGAGYGLFPIDKEMMANLYDLVDPLERASAYINAYENMLSGKSTKPKELLAVFLQGLSVEKNEMNLRLITGYLTNIYWTFLTAEARNAMYESMEKTIWNAMEQQQTQNNKKILFNAYQNVYLSADAGKRMYNIWLKQTAPNGVKLLEDDYSALALTLALKTDTANTILKDQLARTKNEDRKNRLIYLMPALSLDVKERDNFFNGLKDRKNRQKEAWVTTALSYLHHPIRQTSSIRYLKESLDLLEEIQKTGDIFFPQSWLAATFSGYNKKEANAVVQDFLKTHPAYNPKLKDKILQTTDNLRRSQIILH